MLHFFYISKVLLIWDYLRILFMSAFLTNLLDSNTNDFPVFSICGFQTYISS